MDQSDDFDVDCLLDGDCSIKTELRNQPLKKQKLKPWLMDQINSGIYPGLNWIDENKQIFKIPWKHFGRPGDFDKENAMLFCAWAVHTNRFNESKPEDVSRWKTNLRCALDRQPEIKRVPEIESSFSDSEPPYRVYQFINSDKNVLSPKSFMSNTASVCSSTCNSPASVLDITSNFSDLNSQMPNDNSIDELDLPDNLGMLGDEGLRFDDNNFHHLQLTLPMTTLQEHCLLVKLFYGEQELGRRIVDNPYGLRIAYGFDPPPLPIQEDTSNLRSIFGPERAEQLYFPSISNQMAMKILENMPRGLVLQERDGCIYATRLCRARVFYSDLIAPTGGANPLRREHTTPVFNYIDEFLPKLSLFTQGGGPMPTAEIYFSFGQTWSQDRPLKNNCVYISITHCVAQCRLSEIQNSPTDIQASEPNSNDILAERLAGLSITQSLNF